MRDDEWVDARAASFISDGRDFRREYYSGFCWPEEKQAMERRKAGEELAATRARLAVLAVEEAERQIRQDLYEARIATTFARLTIMLASMALGLIAGSWLAATLPPWNGLYAVGVYICTCAAVVCAGFVCSLQVKVPVRGTLPPMATHCLKEPRRHDESCW